MSKLDLKKKLKEFYQAQRSRRSRGQIVTITGRGAPGGPAYHAALNALYSAIYTIKFKCKAEGKDFTVMILEGLWWWADPSITDLADAHPMKEWNWKSMIRIRDFVTEDTVGNDMKIVKEKKGIEEADKLKLESFHEGLSAQVMNLRSYSEEGPTAKRLLNLIRECGCMMRVFITKFTFQIKEEFRLNV